MGVEACPHCSTRYVVPEDRTAVREATADAVTVWAGAPEARIPDFANDPLLHRCRQGRPACVRCGAVGRVGNALLGHPPEPLVCLACTKALSVQL